MMMKFDIKYCVPFLTQKPNSLQDRITQIQQEFLAAKHQDDSLLGWFDGSVDENKLLDSVQNIINSLPKCEVVVVIGVGGSYLGAKAGLDFTKHFFKVVSREIIFAGFNLSADYHQGLLDYLKDKDFCINVISKSGATIEPAIAFRLFSNLCEQKYGLIESAKRIIVTTDETSGCLLNIAKQKNYRILYIPQNVGGRYSVHTPVGLLPLALGGLNIKLLIEGIKNAQNDTRLADIEKNSAYLYAALRYLLYQQGYAIEVLVNFEPALNSLAEWWKQLFAESEGKENKGLFVTSLSYSTDLHSVGQYIQEGPRHMVQTVIGVKETTKLIIPSCEKDLDDLNYVSGKDLQYINEQALVSTMKAHFDGGVPNILIEIPRLDEYWFGYLTHFFMKACSMSARLLGVNPFDQPGVEEYKNNLTKRLGKKRC